MTHSHILDRIKKVCAVGAGTMGVGTVLEFARYGYDVSFYARDAIKLADAMATIQPILEDLADNDLVDRNEIPAILGRIKPTTNLEEAAKDADLVMESIAEKMEIKQDMFARIANVCPKHTIFATNTSALDPTEIASALPAEQRKNFVVMHGFNPPHLMPLVEVVPGSETSHETVETAFQILMRIGKKPVKLNKATPGFVVNYIQAAIIWKALELHVVGSHSAEEIDTEFKQKLGVSYQALGPLELAGQDLAHLTHKHAELLLAEMRAKPPETSIAQRLQDTATIAALELVANGVASAKTVDEAFVNSLGRRYAATGPLQSADMGGLDIFQSIFNTLGYLSREAAVSHFMNQKVVAGHAGTKSAAKQGVYEWTPETIQSVGGRRKADLIKGLKYDAAQRGTRQRARWDGPDRARTDRRLIHFPAPAPFVI